MAFTFLPTQIPEVILITPKRFDDERGFFMEKYKASEFKANGIGQDFVQDNFSRSKRGVVRGLHYQLEPEAQGKLVSVVSGKIWDVAVDIRKSSPTFRHWVAFELDSEGGQALFLPPGFAHGFVALADGTTVLYKTSKEFAPSLDRGIFYLDSELNVKWPLEDLMVSKKDAALPLLKDAQLF